MSRTDRNRITTTAGSPYPLGATATADGVDFAVFSRHATEVTLLLYDRPDAAEPARQIDLDRAVHRTGDYWHVSVGDLGPGQVYGYRVAGPHGHKAGHRFDRQKVLLDPYARAVVGLDRYERDAARQPGDNGPVALRAVVAGHDDFDWEGDRPLPPRRGRELIYELHVGGFTAAEDSGVVAERRGTFAGLIDKIPYLQELGVTAVELLPVHCFDPQDTPSGRENYWGYSPVAFFAPHPGYATDRRPLGPLDDFRAMIKAMHRAGLRVILDVVFNHTAEGGADGAVLSWRGFDNSVYYHLDAQGRDRDFSGCGNTLDATEPVVARLISDAARYWVQTMHVDGLRFDLASVLSRDRYGAPDNDAPLPRKLATDPQLAGATLIAEAWDAAGLYQVGHFPGETFAEWNGSYRDTVRRFWRGDEGVVETLMARIVGSKDLFYGPRRLPRHSVNFVTCHDGFTLNDLVSYNRKHNEANGEDNRDGSDVNLSWNSGVEGPTGAPEVAAVRSRQVRNFLCMLLLSQGTPMLLMGDEVRRSQSGNNNAYCQNNRLGWFDWSGPELHPDLLRFVRLLIGFTQQLPALALERFWTVTGPERTGDLSWHGVAVGRPDWSHRSHSLAYTLHDRDGGHDTHLLLNAYWRPLEFALPDPPAGRVWHRIVDTALASPDDIRPPAEANPLRRRTYRLVSHTTVVLQAL
jgi:isoamylase